METATLPSTWQEAFEKHSVRDVRTFEKQLQASSSRDKERLRVLVGSNYRDLLDTAQEIVSLSSLTRAAEDHISDLSSQCKPPLNGDVSNSRSSVATYAAQHKLLVHCVLRSETSSQKGQFVQSAQLLTIARLLVSSLRESSQYTGFADYTTTRISKARRTLLARIDHLIIKPSLLTKSLVQLLCAYCLLSSSSSADAIEHFKQLRLQRLKSYTKIEASRRQLHKATHYVNVSAIVLKALLDRPLDEELQKLQQRSILDQISGSDLDFQSLDFNRSLIPDDISKFTPFIQRTVLTVSKARDQLQEFSEQAAIHLKNHVDTWLQNRSNVAMILQQRTEIVEILLQSSFGVRLPMASVDSINSSFMKRVMFLVEKHGASIETLGSIAQNVVGNENQLRLWAECSASSERSENSRGNMRRINNAYLGLTPRVNEFTRKLELWSRKLGDLNTQLDELKKIRWQDKIGDYDEEDEVEVDSIVRRLSQEDVIGLKKSLHETFEKSTHQLQAAILNAAGSVATKIPKPLPDDSASKAVAVLRVIRSTQNVLENAFTSVRLTSVNETVQSLHQVLAIQILTDLESEFSPKNPSFRKKHFVGEDLPSPLTFSVLQYVCNRMISIGGHDIWTASAVDLLKMELAERLSADSMASCWTCGDFDREYLHVAFTPRQNEAASAKVNRIDLRAATAYWQKTRALFGVLDA